VIALIGIIAAVAVGQYRNAIKKAKEAVLKEDLFTMRSCIDQYLADKGHYPSSLQELVDQGYLRFMPFDPITQSKDTWVEIFADPDTEEGLEPTDELGGGPGVMDVRSGAEGTALNGTAYSEW
jgi:general secretion pathway protein G